MIKQELYDGQGSKASVNWGFYWLFGIKKKGLNIKYFYTQTDSTVPRFIQNECKRRFISLIMGKNNSIFSQNIKNGENCCSFEKKGKD